MKLLAPLLRDPNPAYVLGFLTAWYLDAALVAFDARFRAAVVAGDVVTPVVRDGGTFALRRADGRDAVTGHAALRHPPGP